MKKLSIVIPIYREKKTVGELLTRIYALQIKGFEKELVLVEDNSKDGTREIAEAFHKNHPDCKLILNDIPRGKGRAVRMGLKSATGDIFAIQDADLEYDVNDYHKLLKPFLESNAVFVLGPRHLDENGDKIRMIRKFHGIDNFYAHFMNFGGLFFHKFFNVLYGTKISDPTTMYKIFTRDLYDKVNLAGNYFELDWEIVSKFIRLGYFPLEIPITYASRGFKEGKKVQIFRDAPKWMAMIIKCRFMSKSKL